ncbi:MAG: PEGA domain-containing protein [Deltaproteobacteria bacterium]|nr:PEGA domain-containing protein [Deltaproteobacteria bacterium]
MRLLTAGIAFASVLGLAAGAAAQETGDTGAAAPEGTESSAREDARMLFEDGVTLMQGENWEAATVQFERSLELLPTRSALFNLAMCQKAQFRYLETMALFERFLAEYRDEADPEEVQRVAEEIAALRELVGEVRVSVNVPGAQVLVDGEPVGTSPLVDPVPVVAGRHVIEARLDGYGPAQRMLPVASGDRLEVSFTLIAEERVGGLRVEANVPGAEVVIDGDLMGAVPFRGVLQEGNHEVEVRAAGYEAQIQTVAIATGDERIVTVSLSEPWGTDPMWFWSMVGLTGAATVATVALGTTVHLRNADYDPAASDAQSRYDEGQGLMIGADVALGVAAAAAVATLVLGFTTSWDADERPADAGPGPADPSGFEASLSPGPGGLGLAVVGRF